MKKLLILTFACCLIGLMSLNLYADPVVDQSQLNTNGLIRLGVTQNPCDITQSFKPSMDNVSGASVSIGLSDSSSVIVTMNLWDKAPWDPTSNPDVDRLVVTNPITVTYADVASPGSMVDFSWTPVRVTPGQEYFLQVLVLTNQLNQPPMLINVAYGATDYYPEGSLFVGGIPAAGMLETHNCDWVFKEFDDTTSQAVPEPCTMLLLGCGLVGVVGFRRKLKK